MAKTIDEKKARQMLMSYVDNADFGDRFYEFAQDLCNKAIKDIESKHSIVDANGEPYTDEDEVMWYDECREDFMKAVFEKVKVGKF